MNYIVDDIGTVVTAMRTDPVLIEALQAGIPTLSRKGYLDTMPSYLYGHREEISNTLLEMEDDKVRKYQKYPLVALRLDTPEKNAEGVIRYTLNIALIMLTDETYKVNNRYDKVFKPILYPMYESFLKQLKNSGLFMWEGDQSRPPHTKLDRPFWGTPQEEKNTANYFNDPLDAIELIDLELTQNYKC